MKFCPIRPSLHYHLRPSLHFLIFNFGMLSSFGIICNKFFLTKQLRPLIRIASLQYAGRSILLNQSRTMELDQTKRNISHIPSFNKASDAFPYPGLSYQIGSTKVPLKHLTLAELLREQSCPKQRLEGNYLSLARYSLDFSRIRSTKR